MKNKILLLSTIFSIVFVSFASAQEAITDQYCDAKSPCPKGLECYNFPNIGLRCANPNACNYFECPKGTQCLTEEIYPPSVICSCVGPACTVSSEDEQTVTYDVMTQAVVYTTGKDNKTVSHNITLKQTTSGNMGILETKFASVKYANKLAVNESKLFMETSVGKKQINIMPEEAVAASEMPNINLIEKIELKEEAKSPVYSVKGKKQAKILFVLPVNLRIETRISAETGKIISIKKPWWGFLAW